MNLNKSISVSKFLLSTSVVMMVVGLILLFVDVYDLFGFKENNFVTLYILLLVFGFIFFAVSMIDLSLTRERNKTLGVETQNIPPKRNSFFIYTGIIAILIIVGFLLFMAMIFLKVSSEFS